MIDGGPPRTPDQVIARKLAACGLDRKAVTVKWEDALQSFEVVIRRNSKTTPESLACIHDAVATEIVTFEDASLQSAYNAYVTNLYRPRMIAEAKARITSLGLLEGFPRRADHNDLADYARAIERHCRVEEGSTLRVSGDSLTVVPPSNNDFTMFEQRFGRVFAALTYAASLGDIDKFGFIGNEQLRE